MRRKLEQPKWKAGKLIRRRERHSEDFPKTRKARTPASKLREAIARQVAREDG